MLWAIPVFTAIGTVVTGFESVMAGRENAALHREAGEAIKQAAESNERSKLLEAANLVLRSNLVALSIELEESAAPMTIGEQVSFCGDLRQFAGMNIWLANIPDSKARKTVAYISFGLKTFANWNVSVLPEIQEARDGISIAFERYPFGRNTNAMNAGEALFRKLIDRNLPAQIVLPGILESNISIPDNTVLLVVGERPPSRRTKALLFTARKEIDLRILEEEASALWLNMMTNPNFKTMLRSNSLRQLEIRDALRNAMWDEFKR